MLLEGAVELGRIGLEGERDRVGELEVEALSRRLHGVDHLPGEPLGDELRRQPGGDHDHRPWPLCRGPALAGRGADEDVVAIHRCRAAGKRKLDAAVAGERGKERLGVGLGERIASLGEKLPEAGPEFFQIGEDAAGDVAVGLTADLELLHVELVADKIGMRRQPGGIVGGGVGEDHLDLRERLPDLELRACSGRTAKRRHLAHQRHPAHEIGVEEPGLSSRVIGEMDTLRHLVAEAADGEVAPDRLGDEGHERRGEASDAEKRLVERPVGIEFVEIALGAVGPPGSPEAVATAAHEPIADAIDERRDHSGRGEVVEGVHPLDDITGRRGELREHPAVEFGSLGYRAPAAGLGQVGVIEAPGLVEERARVEAVDVGVDHEERIDVPEPDEKLRHALADRPLAVADRRPRGLTGEEVPAQRVGAVGVEDHPRLFVVALALAHLLPVLPEHQPEDDAGAKRVGIVGCRGNDALGKRPRPVAAEEERADRQLAVEPAARLVDRLGDEVGGELRGEILVTRVRPAPLSKRHRARVKPAVDHLRHPPHP